MQKSASPWTDSLPRFSIVQVEPGTAAAAARKYDALLASGSIV